MDRRTLAEEATKPAPSNAAADEPSGWRFGEFVFDRLRGELVGPGDATIVLRPKAVALLCEFLLRPGRLIGREDLMAAVWPSTVVTDDSLVQCVGDLRAALNDRAQQLIRTVPRRGYRFESAVEPVFADGAGRATLAQATTPREAAPAEACAVEPLPAADGQPTAGLRMRPWTIAGIAAIALLVAAAAWQAQRPPRVDIDAEIMARHVFAVMPFEAEDGRLRETAASVTHGVVAEMSSRKSQRVIGPAATAELARTPVPDAAAKLGATYVVTGRVSQAGDARPMVDVHLMAAGGSVIGAGRFAILAGSDGASLVGQLVMSLASGRLGDIEQAEFTRAGHVPSAAELAMLGWHNVYRRGSGDTAQGRERFEQALRADPNSIVALNGLGAVYAQERQDRVALTPEQIGQAERAIETALRLAPNDPTVSLNWSNLQTFRGRPDLALPAIEKAARITPGYSNVHLMRARTLISLGRASEVRDEIERAAQLAGSMGDSFRTAAAWLVGAEAALMLGDEVQALEFARRAVAERPAALEFRAVLAAAEALGGRPEVAAAEMAAYRRARPNSTVATYDDARPSTDATYLAQRARFYDGLRKAGLPER